MKRILISICFAWFLVIQAYRNDSTFIAYIPFYSEKYCNSGKKLLEVNKSRVWYDNEFIYYTCVDVGNINT